MTEWLDRAIALDAGGNVALALDTVFDAVDDMLLAGEFAAVDEILRRAGTDEMSLTLLVGILSITLAADDKLPSRHPFYDAVWRKCVAAGRPPVKLLGGLRS